MTASAQPESKPTSRRALLAGALGGVGAWMASAIGRASPAQAGTDGDLVLETSNATGTATGINGGGFYVNNSNSNGQIAIDANRSGGGTDPSWALHAINTQLNGVGVAAYSTTGFGLDASGEPAAIHAVSSHQGVWALASGGSGSAGVHAEYNGNAEDATAIEGRADAGTGVRGAAPKRGVVGTVDGGGAGVYGYSTQTPGYPSVLNLNIPSNVGVAGECDPSTGRGVFGMSAYGTGVFGASGNYLTPTTKPKTGVYGFGDVDKYSRGVTGESPAGIGVYGVSSSGYGVYSAGKVYTTQFYELSEIATPATPAANRARLFIKDNGLGKTQVCVKFANGTVKVLATEG